MSIQQQNMFIELGKQLLTKQQEEETYNQNLKFLEDKFSTINSNIKIKKKSIYTQSINEIIKTIDTTKFKVFDENIIYYVLYTKFLKHKINILQNDITQLKDENQYQDSINESFIEELNEKDDEIKSINSEKNFYKYHFNSIGKIFFILFTFLYINFVALYAFGTENFTFFWINFITSIVNLFLYLLYIIGKPFINIFINLNLQSLYFIL